jgi:hypothetical protein
MRSPRRTTCSSLRIFQYRPADALDLDSLKSGEFKLWLKEEKEKVPSPPYPT